VKRYTWDVGLLTHWHKATSAMSSKKNQEKSIPKTRLGRFGQIARLAGGVAAGMIGEGAKQLGQGKRPKVSDLLLTPANARKVANQLATMRGAAMKVGQLLSMETSDFLPPELADILAQLRNRAFIMPRAQLIDSLVKAYGEDWRAKFQHFEFEPLAAASIGQVHRAKTLDGQDIVLKIQYPGVAKSIDSDVDNIATLFKVTRILPKHMDITGLLKDAKLQLHEEANYLQEAEYLEAFRSALGDQKNYIIPKHYPELSTERILAMDFLSGEPIESLGELDPSLVDNLMTAMFELTFKELFELRLMQTDANFANYLFQHDTHKIALLDFGASRRFSKRFAIDYKRLLRAVAAGDSAAIVLAADNLGYKASEASTEYQEFLVAVFSIALEPFSKPGLYDFKTGQISDRLSQLSQDGYSFKEFWQTPPTDILYLHRKLGGMYMLATRLGARVNTHALASPYLEKLAL
jgi:predicted unusual protein kinase regulating ubiquinone biosynthesis (AarF/ABC1/UbiB family)